MALLLSLSFCSKEDTSLGEQLQGSWLVQSYKYDGEEILEPKDSFSIDFNSFRKGKGKTNWYRSTFIVIAPYDTSGGAYSIITEQSINTIHIEWSNPAFWGGFEEANFNILQFTRDTLVLDEEKPGAHFIMAIRH